LIIFQTLIKKSGKDMAHNLKKHKALILILKILPAIMVGFYLLGNAGLGIGT
jgi:hypothetical protein